MTGCQITPMSLPATMVPYNQVSRALRQQPRLVNRGATPLMPTILPVHHSRRPFQGTSQEALNIIRDFKTDECVAWPLGHTASAHAACQGTSVSRRLLGLVRGDGLVARHTCHNAWCVNVAHLVSGTPQDNSNDMKAAGRHRSSGGALSFAVVPGVDVQTGKVARCWWNDESTVQLWTNPTHLLRRAA